MTDMRHMDHLEAVAASDVAELRRKEATYRGSWKASGGRSAWFMLRRKVDRLLVMMARPPEPDSGSSLQSVDDTIDAVRRAGAGGGTDVWLTCEFPGTPRATVALLRHLRDCYVAEDVFAKVAEAPGGADGTVLAEVRDLRRYLLLVEAEMVARGVVTDVAPSRNQLLTEDTTHTVRLQGGQSGQVSGGPDIVADDIFAGTITGNLIQPEPNSPGTPEDGEHHEPRAQVTREGRRVPRYDDGPQDGATSPPGWFYIATTDPVTGVTYYNVDRRVVEMKRPTGLQVELNAKEFELTEPRYRGMYVWTEAGEGKFLLRPRYREGWGRQ
jgi:hypothetical protein